MDRDVLKKIQNGNKEAFLFLYDEYADYALRVAYAVTRNKEIANDAVQETFLRVYRYIHQFDCDKPFKPWFYRILMNECNRLLKKENKMAVYLEYEENTLAQKDQDKLQYDDLYQALDNLEKHQKDVILLKCIHDLTDKEIAEILHENINTVKSRLYKGRLKLKSVLTSFFKGGERNE